MASARVYCPCVRVGRWVPPAYTIRVYGSGDGFRPSMLLLCTGRATTIVYIYIFGYIRVGQWGPPTYADRVYGSGDVLPQVLRTVYTGRATATVYSCFGYIRVGRPLLYIYIFGCIRIGRWGPPTYVDRIYGSPDHAYIPCYLVGQHLPECPPHANYSTL